MQEIVLFRLENWIEKYGPGAALDMIGYEPCVIVGAPCAELLELQNKGHCVLAELTHLQGLSEEEIAEALCKEEAVRKFENVCIHAAKLPQAYFRRIWCKSQGRPVLIAETERLIIRESSVEDAAAFWELYSDRECQKYLEAPAVDDAEARPGAGVEGRELQLAAYRQYITEYRNGQYAFWEYGMWTVVEKASGAVVGRAGLEQQIWEAVREEPVQASGDAEAARGQGCADTGQVISLGYALLPQFRGRGYAAEACLAILEYCRECEYAETVYVKIDAENVPSRKVYERLKACRRAGVAAPELMLK